MTAIPIVVPPHRGEAPHVFDHISTYKLGSDATDGAFSLTELSIPEGAEIPAHRHDAQMEATYVLEGRLTARVENHEFEVKTGDFLLSPQGQLRGFVNTGSEETRLLVLIMPGGNERRLRELTPLSVNGTPPPTSALRELADRYGLDAPVLNPTSHDTADGPEPDIQTLHFIPTGGGRRKFEHPGQRIWNKTTAEDTGGVFSFVEAEIEPGSGVPLHVHHREDEIFYILSGRFAIQVGEETVEATPGTCLFAPRGIPHLFQSVGDESGRMLVVVTPGGIENLFAEMEALFNDVGPFLTFAALLDRYAITLLPAQK